MYAKTKIHVIVAKLISAFVFATLIVHSYVQNFKLLAIFCCCSACSVCVRPCQKIQAVGFVTLG